jgi:hypothetical protein
MKATFHRALLLLLVIASSYNLASAAFSVTLSKSSYHGFNISCFGGSDGWLTANPLGGTSPYSYLWSNSATTQTISNLSAGTYTVTVTDNVSATATASFTLVAPAPLNATCTRSLYSNGYNVSCYQCFNGSINTTPTGGATPFRIYGMMEPLLKTTVPWVEALTPLL